MNILFYGKMSSGKTTGAVEYAIQLGKPIISNIFIKHYKFEKQYSTEELLNIISDNEGIETFRNKTLLFDEVHQIADARSPGNKSNKIFNNFFVQSHKISCDFLLTSQLKKSQVDKIIRKLIDIKIKCARYDLNGNLIIFGKRLDLNVYLLQTWEVDGASTYIRALKPYPTCLMFETEKLT